MPRIDPETRGPAGYDPGPAVMSLVRCARQGMRRRYWRGIDTIWRTRCNALVAWREAREAQEEDEEPDDD